MLATEGGWQGSNATFFGTCISFMTNALLKYGDWPQWKLGGLH